MNKLILLGLTAALAACNSEDHNIVADSVPDDGFNAAAEGNIVLPPSIQASKTYRCADNTIVKVDWLSDGKSATVSLAENGSPVLVTMAEGGTALTASDGTTLSGDSNASAIKVGLGGKPAQTCNH